MEVVQCDCGGGGVDRVMGLYDLQQLRVSRSLCTLTVFIDLVKLKYEQATN